MRRKIKLDEENMDNRFQNLTVPRDFDEKSEVSKELIDKEEGFSFFRSCVNLK